MPQITRKGIHYIRLLNERYPLCREDVFYLKTLCEEIMERDKVESVKIICQRSWQMDQIFQPISGRQFLTASDFMKRKFSVNP